MHRIEHLALFTLLLKLFMKRIHSTAIQIKNDMNGTEAFLNYFQILVL